MKRDAAYKIIHRRIKTRTRNGVTNAQCLNFTSVRVPTSVGDGVSTYVSTLTPRAKLATDGIRVRKLLIIYCDLSIQEMLLRYTARTLTTPQMNTDKHRLGIQVCYL